MPVLLSSVDCGLCALSRVFLLSSQPLLVSLLSLLLSPSFHRILIEHLFYVRPLSSSQFKTQPFEDAEGLVVEARK